MPHSSSSSETMSSSMKTGSDSEKGEQSLIHRGSHTEHETILENIDPKKYKALVRRVDLQIIPIAMLLYCFSFLDRVNIGNAKIMGLEEDLNLHGYQYQIALSVFFVSHVCSEVPSNLLLKKCFKPNRFLPCLAIAWGLIATATGAVQGFRGLIAVRVLMGIAEAGLTPGLITFLTMFYSRTQLAQRIAYLFIASAVASAVGGLLAFGIAQMDGVGGLRSWRWLMIIEGIPSMFLGVIAFFVLPESSEKATFLSEEDRALLIATRRAEPGHSASAQEFDFADVKAALKDWQIWVFCLASFCVAIMFHGFSTFLPTIVESIGIGSKNPARANALTVPVYAVSVAVYFVMARVSDRLQHRGLIAAAFMLFPIAGYAMLLSQSGPAVTYAGTFVLACGLYTSVGIPIAWLPGNKPRWGKRAFATAAQAAASNMAGAFMPFIFHPKLAPYFTTAYSTSVAFITCGALIYVAMSLYYIRVNKRRDRGDEDWKMEGLSEEEIDAMGDKSPLYRYTP